jgi:diguanylate cyclase (GGDEF)-like protein
MTMTYSKGKVLLVQNAQTQGNSTKRHLEGAGYSVVWAGSGVSALATAKQHALDLIVIDAALPDMAGGDLCRRFRSRAETKTVPIILLTANGHVPFRTEGADGGPDSCLPKPYAESELEAKITATLRARDAGRPEPDRRPEMKQAQTLSETAPVRETEQAIGAAEGEGAPSEASRTDGGPSPPAVGPDSADAGTPPPFGRAGDEVIDPATGLFGKKQFRAMFSKEFKRSARFKQQLSCMLIDLDGRKIGREGDASTLREIIGLVQRTIREVDTAAWWSGEALIVLLPNTMRNDAVQAAARILESVATHPFSWSDSSKVTMSIGVAGLPDRGIDSEEKLIEAAAAACKRARDLMLPHEE